MERFLFFMILIMLCGCSGEKNTTTLSTVGKYGENIPITRAEVCKMMALAKYNSEDIDLLERKISFEDTDMKKWYDKYINSAFTSGYVSGVDDTHFEPEGYLSLRQAQFLINKISKSEKLQLKYNPEDRDKPISYAMWVEAFEKIAEKEKLNFISQDLVVYATKDQCSKLGEDYILTDKGLFETDGIDFSAYYDCKLNVITKGKEISAIKSIVSDCPEINNATVVQTNSKGVDVKINGATRFFKIENSPYKKGDKVKISFLKNGNYEIKYM